MPATRPTPLDALHRIEGLHDAAPMVLYEALASAAGLPAIRQLTGDGINVNITLLFGIERYEEGRREVTDQLLEDGVTLFRNAFDTPLEVIDRARRGHSS